MKISVRHKITRDVLEIRTASNNPDTPVKPAYPSHPSTEVLKSELRSQSGFYGHTIDPDNTTNLDLYVALKNLETFALESATPVPKPNPLPEGVQT